MSSNPDGSLDDFKDDFRDVRVLSLQELKNDKSFQKLKQRSKLLYKDNGNESSSSNPTNTVVLTSGIKRKDVNEFQISKQSKKNELIGPITKTVSKSKVDKFSKIRGIKLTKARHDFFNPFNEQILSDRDTSAAIVDTSQLTLTSDSFDALSGIVSTPDKTLNEGLVPTIVEEEDTIQIPLKQILPIENETSIMNEPDISIDSVPLNKNGENGSTKENIPEPETPQIANIKDDIDSNDIDSNDIDDNIYSTNEDDISAVKSRVLRQLLEDFINVQESKLLSDKYFEIYRMFENTILHNEGHSVLLFGPRMCGKTSIINTAIQELSKKHKDHFLVVRLNFFIHSDDTIALREIARQLDLKVKELSDTKDSEMSDDEGGNFEQRSINDTFANILSILDKDSHNQNSSQAKIPIIFIIDEFEKFTNSNKQTLLYNLFDLSQSSSSAITVVGVSSKVTTRELLEKRVRSRFSQRIITITKSTTVDEFWSNAKLGLTLNSEFIESLNDPSYGHLWNTKVEQLYDETEEGKKLSNLKKLVYHNYYTLKNFKSFNNDCAVVIAKVNKKNPFPDDANFLKYSSCQEINNIQSIISTLSNLELILIIAAARSVEKFDIPAINFNLAYAEYQEMMKDFNVSSSSSTNILDSRFRANFKINQKIWSSKILKNSWEALYKMGILLDSAGVTTNNDGHIITNVNLNKNLIIEENKMVQIDVTLEELGNLVNDPIFKRLTKL